MGVMGGEEKEKDVGGRVVFFFLLLAVVLVVFFSPASFFFCFFSFSANNFAIVGRNVVSALVDSHSRRADARQCGRLFRRAHISWLRDSTNGNFVLYLHINATVCRNGRDANGGTGMWRNRNDDVRVGDQASYKETVEKVIL